MRMIWRAWRSCLLGWMLLLLLLLMVMVMVMAPWLRALCQTRCWWPRRRFPSGCALSLWRSHGLHLAELSRHLAVVSDTHAHTAYDRHTHIRELFFCCDRIMAYCNACGLYTVLWIAIQSIVSKKLVCIGSVLLASCERWNCRSGHWRTRQPTGCNCQADTECPRIKNELLACELLFNCS